MEKYKRGMFKEKAGEHPRTKLWLFLLYISVNKYSIFFQTRNSSCWKWSEILSMTWSYGSKYKININLLLIGENMVKLHHQTALRNDDPGKVQLIHIFQTLFTSSFKLFQNQQSSLPLTSRRMLKFLLQTLLLKNISSFYYP